MIFYGPLLVSAVLKEIPQAQHAFPLLLFTVYFLYFFLKSLLLQLFIAGVRQLIQVELLLLEDFIAVDGRLSSANECRCLLEFTVVD